MSKKIIPKMNPTVAGNHEIIFCSSAISIDGISKDHIDAATITPAAKPSKIFSIFSFIFFRIRKTIPDPKVVPINGIIKPKKVFI